MISYYLDKGHNIDTLINLSNSEKLFYIASMSFNLEEEANKPRLF